MDCNLGANRIAQSVNDAAAFGNLYQWGRGNDGYLLLGSGETKCQSIGDNPGHGNFIKNASAPYDWRFSKNDNLWQGVNGINNPCPAGFRIPTRAEWQAERQSWNGQYNSAGAIASPLKLPMAGYRRCDSGMLSNVGYYGYYWTSTVHGINARAFSFDASSTNSAPYYRAQGFSVRCIKN